MFAVIELVKNRRTKEPLLPWPFTPPSLKRLVGEGRRHGVSFATRGNLIILAPPLVISRGQLIQALEILDRLLLFCDKEAGY